MFTNLIKADLPTQVAQLLLAVQTMTDDLRALRRALVDIQAQPDADPLIQALPYTSADLLVVTGLLISADTTGLYTLVLGNLNLLSFYLTAFQPTILPLEQERRVVVTRGMKISITAPANATVQATIWALPREVHTRRLRA